MKRGKAAALAMTAGIIAVGCGQQEGTKSELSPQQPAGCVSIRVGPNLLDGPKQWFPLMGAAAFQPFWRSQYGLHAAWQASEYTGSADLPDNKPGSSRLVVSTFAPETGELLGNQLLDVFPPQLDPSLTAIRAATGSPDGSYALAFSYVPNRGEPRVVRVLLGHMKDGAETIWTPTFSSKEMLIFHLGWDGEAYAVHAAAQADGSVYLIRLSPDGTVLLEPTKVGAVTVIWDNNFDAETDPATGMTVIVSPGPKGVIVMGHDRQGRMLQGMPPEGWIEVQAQGQQSQGLDYFPTVALGLESFSVAWGATEYNTYLQPVDFQLQRLGDARLIPSVALGNPPRTYYPIMNKTMSRYQEHWWLAGHVNRTIDSIMLADDGQVQSRTLISHSPLECVETDTCTDATSPLQADHFTSVVWKSELWFGFTDNSGSYAPVRDPLNISPYRIVLVRDGCTYPSEYDRLTQR